MASAPFHSDEALGEGGAVAPHDPAAVAKALGHPARVEIVRLLHAQAACVGSDLAEAIHLAPSTVSEHLRILKAAGVVTATVERPRILYSVNPAALDVLRAFLGLVSTPQPN